MLEERMNKNQSIYLLGICELFNENIHGFIQGESSPEIYYHYFMRNEISIQEFYEDIRMVEEMCQRLNYYYTNRICRIPYYYLYHPIPNYRKIIQSNQSQSSYDYRYIKPEIIERIILPKGGECIAIIKTFWLRIIQRTWKKVFLKQKEILNKRMSIYCIKYLEIHGSYPSDCSYYPTINGMLSS